ncbi:MAG: OadG family protein [Burkholderiales bacterium]
MSDTHFQNLLAAAELLVGFVIVMLTLSVLWGLTALMGRIVARFERRGPQAAVAARAAPERVVSGGVEDDELAVIAAAVALTLDVPHRVVSVQPQPSSWGQQGRRDLHGSHRIH